ncbi:hypothetical protein N2152v2_006470 [Parachlorella kessleri]
MLDEIEADLLRCEAVLAGSSQYSDGRLKDGASQQSGAAASQPCRSSGKAAAPQPHSAGGKPKPKSMADLLAMLENAPAGPIEIDTGLLYSPQSSVDLSASPSNSSVGGRSLRGRQSPAQVKAGSHGSGVTKGRAAAKARLAQELGPAEYNDAGTIGQEFSLQAFRPAGDAHGTGTAEGAGLGDAFGSSLHLVNELLQSPGGSQHSLEWGEAAWDVRLDQQRSLNRGGASGLQSPADSEAWHQLSHSRPVSAPQQHAVSEADSISPVVNRRGYTVRSKPRSSSQAAQAADGDLQGRHSQRQLKLDDVLALGIAGSTAGLLQAGREARLERLAQPRKDLWEKAARAKLEEQRQELKECTFAPQVGRPPTRLQGAGLPVDERLYRQAEGKWEELQRAKQAQESAQLAECTFSPQLNQPDRHLRREYTPIHQRVSEEQRKRSVKLAQMRVLDDLTNPDTTFTPRLNPKSRQLAAEKEERELYSPATGISLRRSKSNAAELAVSEACTFSPALNPASQRLLDDSASVPSDFKERLRYYSQKRDLKQRQLQAEQDAQSCTFRPDTGNAVEVLAFSERAGNLLETEAERYERMALDEAARLEAKRAAKEQEIYGGMNFKPRLNPKSLRMAKSSTVEELASTDKVARKVAQLKAEEEQRLRQECTFRPNTAKPPVRGYGYEYEPAPQPKARLAIAGQGFENLVDRIHEYQAEKEAKAARVKEEEERRQLRECSFVPEINKQPVKAKGPVVVRGMERYLELKQLAEKQKREAEERASQVFNLNPQGPPAGRTVPRPFKLTGLARLEQRATTKQSEALQAALQERMAQCTFKPQTNYAKRQQALAGILSQHDDGMILLA